MLLSELKVNDKCVVKEILNPDFQKRLFSLGLAKGTKIEVVRIINGDIIEISLRKFFLALRKETASKIEVELING